jgi:hypothetical protein
MTGTREKPLGLDMPFEEALERFIGVVPSELPESVKLTKKKGPPKRPPSVAGRHGPKDTPD